MSQAPRCDKLSEREPRLGVRERREKWTALAYQLERELSQMRKAYDQLSIAHSAAPGGAVLSDNARVVALPPSGWKLVPVEVTSEMQRAYFNVIDKNLSRVENDVMFGRHESARQAYRAMLAAAPKIEPSEMPCPICPTAPVCIVAPTCQRDVKPVDMRAILVEVEDALICQDDDRAHYCPNCDRSLYNIRARVRAALAESPSPVERPK